MKKKHLDNYTLDHVPEDEQMRAYDGMVKARDSILASRLWKELVNDGLLSLEEVK